MAVSTLAYTSYHTVTIGTLIPGWTVAAVFTLLVFAAGLFWARLRLRYDSVWPALLSHTGATLGYMAVCYQILP